jgi:hypothetical protein
MNSNWNGVRPESSEYAEFYQNYVTAVGAGNIIDILLNQMQETYTLISSLTPEQAVYRYAEDKWTVKEVIGHLIDTERIFACRCLCFSREQDAVLPGFDQDVYVQNGNYNARSLASLGKEYYSLRNANVHLFRSLPPSVHLQKGTANSYPVTVRAIPFIIAGHERHHLQQLKSKYRITA